MALLPFSSPRSALPLPSPPHLRLQSPPLILRAFCTSSSSSSSSSSSFASPISTSGLGPCIRQDSGITRVSSEFAASPDIDSPPKLRSSETFSESRFRTAAERPIPPPESESESRVFEGFSEIRVPEAYPEIRGVPDSGQEEGGASIRTWDGISESRFEKEATEIQGSGLVTETRYQTSGAEPLLLCRDEIAAADSAVKTDSDLCSKSDMETSFMMQPSPSSSPPLTVSSSSSLYSSSQAPPSSLQSRDSRSKVVRTAWEALVRWSRSWQLLNAKKATNVLQTTNKVVVIGGGSFGTAIAVLLARNKSEMQVSLLLRDASLAEFINKEHVNRKYFPKHKLPHNIVATTDAQDAFKDSEFCIHAVPVQYSADFLKSISEHVPANLPFFSVSKGLELSSLEMMSQLIPRALGNQRQPVAVISGPSFSIELMDELPTAMVVASKDKELARSAQQLLASRYLRINTSSDVVGVEIAGALKNVLAIAAGIVEGMNLGNNCMAALVAQGCSEIRWLAEKMGAKSTTLAGLSGAGDIMLTCFVNLSRNRTVGVRLGAGESLSDILSSMNQVAEGVATAGAVIALARKYRVQMPVLTAVARILENELTPKKAVLELMSLPQVEEV